MINITLESVNRVGVEDEWNFSNDEQHEKAHYHRTDSNYSLSRPHRPCHGSGDSGHPDEQL